MSNNYQISTKNEIILNFYLLLLIKILNKNCYNNGTRKNKNKLLKTKMKLKLILKMYHKNKLKNKVKVYKIIIINLIKLKKIINNNINHIQ